MFQNFLNRANEQLSSAWNDALRQLAPDASSQSQIQEIVNLDFVQEEMKREEQPSGTPTAPENQDRFSSLQEEKEAPMTFMQFLEQNQKQSFIQSLIQNYQKEQMKGSKIKTGKRSTSIKDEVLEIINDLENKQEILSNLEPIYQQEVSEDELLQFQIRSLKQPIEMVELMERCEDLGRILKVINLLLAFNVMKNQDQFVNGVDTIDSIYDDLKIVRENASNSRKSVEFIQTKMIYSTAKVLLLKRKQQRLKKAKALTQMLIQTYLKEEQRAIKLIQKYEFGQAYELIQQVLVSITLQQSEFQIVSLTFVKEKFEKLLGLLRDQITQTLSRQGIRFEKFFFDKVLAGFSAGTFENMLQTQVLLKSKPQNPGKQIFLHHLKENLRQQAVVEIKKSIFKFIQNPQKLKEIGIDSENPQIKMQSLQRMIPKGFYLTVLKDIFQSLASMIYNQHLITKFLLFERQDFGDIEQVKTDLLKDRENFWEYIQEKLIQFLKSSFHEIIDLTTVELLDFLVLCNIIIEVGSSFSGKTESSSFQAFIQDEVLQKYLEKFKEEMSNNIKNLLESEDWNRLPLPSNFSIKEMTDPFYIFPKNFSKLISHFIKGKSSLSSDNKENIDDLQKKPYNISSNQILITYELREVHPELNKDFSSKEEFLYFSEQNFKPLQKVFSKMSLSDESDEECFDIGEEEQDNRTSLVNYSGLGQLEGASKQLTAYQQQKVHLNINLVLSQSALNFVKGNFSKHIQLMSLSSSIAFDTFISLTQICEIYAFTVFYTFVDSQQFKRLFDESIFEQDVNSLKTLKDLTKISDSHEIHIFQNRFKTLQNHLVRIKGFIENNLLDSKNEERIIKQQILSNPALIFISKLLPNSVLFETLQQDNQDLVLIEKQIVSIESLKQIQESLNNLKEPIKQQLNIQQQSFQLQFFSAYNKFFEQLSDFLYLSLASRILEQGSSSFHASLIEVMQNVQFVNWNLKAEKGEVSTFVEKILGAFGQHQQFLEGVQIMKIPRVKQKLIQGFVEIVALELLDSISKIKKQNNFGRKSLRSDIAHLKKMIETESGQKFEVLEQLLNYVDAFFLSKEDLLHCIKESVLKYTFKQTMNLVEASPTIYALKSSEKKEFLLNVEIFYKDYFQTFMCCQSSHSY